MSLVGEMYYHKPLEDPWVGAPVNGGFCPVAWVTPAPEGVQLVCRNCDAWQPDVLAFPDSKKPGSMRICADGCKTDAGMWCSAWRYLSLEKVIERANEGGRLF